MRFPRKRSREVRLLEKIILVEQDASLTLNLTERMYILDHGRVGLEGKSRELMDNEEIKKVYFQLG